jgi:DNA-binding CsgD family transcriptional regulator
VLLVSADSRLLFANLAAKAMLGRGDGLALRRGRFGFTDPCIDDRYQHFIERASDTDGGSSLVLRVHDPGLAGAYRVLVSALGTVQSAAAFSLFVYEPQSGRQHLPPKVLAGLYGLCPSEARLANELFAGRSVRQAAAALGITANTARSTLKHIFAKCAVGSQAELLQLLALGPRTL